MEIGGQNCIDETKPYNVSRFTTETNQTNGVVNSSFAKIAVPTTPLSQWFDRDSVPYKYYYPPAERIRRLKLELDIIMSNLLILAYLIIHLCLNLHLWFLKYCEIHIQELLLLLKVVKILYYIFLLSKTLKCLYYIFYSLLLYQLKIV